MFTRLHIQNRTTNSPGATSEPLNIGARVIQRAPLFRRTAHRIPRSAYAGVTFFAVFVVFACLFGAQSNLLGLFSTPQPNAIQQSALHDLSSLATASNGATENGPTNQSNKDTADPSKNIATPTAGKATENSDDALNEDPYEQGMALIRFKPDVDPHEAIDDLSRTSGIENLELGNTADDYVEVKFPATISVKDAIELCARSEYVDAAQPNFRYYLMDGDEADTEGGLAAGALPANGDTISGPDPAPKPITLNDGYASDQWALESIHAYEAWQTARGDSPKNGKQPVTVAVIDNIIDTDHPDLKNNVVAPYNAVSGIAGDDVAGKSYEKSNRDHGTHVAGIVAAQANNTIGCAGVSHNARVMPIRAATDSGGFTTSALVRAFAYAMQNRQAYNVRVINLSVGAPMSSNDWMKGDDAILSKIDEAWDAGIVTVTAACNAGIYSSSYVDVPFSCYPGDYDKCVNVISLCQSTNGPAKASTSNYNTTGTTSKDISAPGADIKSTIKNSDYGLKGGTSMAAPCVAGVLALELTAHPELAPQEAVDRLYASAIDLGKAGFDELFGYGEVDARVVNFQSAVTIAGPSAIAVGDEQAYVLNPAQPGGWNWTCSDINTASLSAKGSNASIKGIKPGQIIVSAQSTNDGDERIARAAISVFDTAITGKTSLDTGQTSALTLSSSNPIAPWTWKSSNASIASVGASTGVVTAHAAGAATITVTLNSCPSVRGSITVTVNGSSNSQQGAGEESSTPPTTIPATNDQTASGSSSTQSSSGTSTKPTQATTTTTSSSGSTSKSAQTTAPSSTTRTSSTATSPKPTASASTTKATTIVRKVNISKASASFSKGYVYSGELIKLRNLKLTYGGKTLKLGRDYTVSYKNNRKAGKATAVIAGKGSYTSTKTLQFTISRAKNTLAIKTKRKTVSISASRVETARRTIARKKAFVITKHRGEMSFKKIRGSKYLGIKKSTGTIIVKKGTPRGVYAVRIKVRAAGTANYKPAALYKTVKVRVK